MLLKRDDIQPNAANKHGSTPLIWASQDGHEGIVKMLLERDDIQPNLADKGGLTPLIFASQNGHEGIVKMLLKRDDIQPNAADKGGSTPFVGKTQTGLLVGGSNLVRSTDSQWVDDPVSWGLQGCQASLKGRGPFKPGLVFPTLARALWNGNEHIVKLLLERDDIQPNAANNAGLTPLTWASQGGNEVIVKLLLKRDDIQPNLADRDGSTPLIWASRNGFEGTIRLLLERDDIQLDAANKDGKTALDYGHASIRRMILDRWRQTSA
ncbi:ankyrin repeat-containing domain protein [Coprinopsis sp. MPI-PUGE-AT-0042]|nr:ankyrin repeat-containing domain protein [Coprinopsis sp. MPI-PUGE-AT-0042]